MVRIPLHFFLAVMVIVRADRLNKSATAGVLWSAAEEEGDLLRKAEPEETTLHNEEFDGGFSSLDSMLQWAIGVLILPYVLAFSVFPLSLLNNMAFGFLP